MPEERIEVGALARDVSVQVATQVANSVATTKTNELLAASASAESARASAENDRVTAEQGRVTAEQGRVLAEQGRVSAEEGRVAAESARQAEIDSKITFGASVKDATLTAGFALLANNLDTKVVQNDVDAYNFRTSGGSLEIGDTCKVGAIVGGSLGWNNLTFYDATTAGIAWTLSASNDPSNPYLTMACDNTQGNTASNCYPVASDRYRPNLKAGDKVLVMWDNDMTGVDYVIFSDGSTYSPLSPTVRSTIINVVNPSSVLIFNPRVNAGGSVAECTVHVRIHNLTAIFGSTIADYIYSLEQAAAGAGVAWFRRYFSKPFYPYHAIGDFTNVQTKGKKYVGFNQLVTQPSVSSSVVSFDKTTFTRLIAGYTYEYNVQKVTNATSWRFGFSVYDLDGNQITDASILNASAPLYASVGLLINNADTSYKVISITPSIDCYVFVNFCYGNTSASSVFEEACLHFHYDGERDGEYEPYDENNYELDPIELIGIPHIDAQGNLYFEGNRYLPDGNVEEGYVDVDLSTLSWTRVLYEDRYIFQATRPTDAVVNTPNLFSPKYSLATYQTTSGIGDQQVYIGNSNINIRDDSLGANDSPTGHLIYKKATTTTSEATPYDEVQSAANWGTEEFLPPENDTRPVADPVGHDTDYLLDIKSKVEIAPDLPSSDGTYVCKVESGSAEYISLGTWLSTNGFVAQQDLSSGITDVFQTLTYSFKRLSKQGKTVTLCIRFQNKTGSAISALTHLFTLPSAASIGAAGIRFSATVEGSSNKTQYFSIAGGSGNVISLDEIANDGIVYISVSYLTE